MIRGRNTRKDGLAMAEILKAIAARVENAEPTAHCFIDNWNCQIVVRFDKRPETEVALLTPYAQGQVKKGHLDADLYSEILFSVKNIANWSVA